MNSFQRIGIVGLGLIGGSLAKLFRSVLPDVRLFGCDSDSHTCSLATHSGLFSEVHPSLTSFPIHLDLVVICTPIPAISETITLLSKHIASPCLFTDVASIKAGLPAVHLAQTNHVYIPGHPMGGTEHTGFASSHFEVLRGAPYLLTPLHVEAPRLTELASFLAGLGFKVTVMAPDIHDRMVAAASHLPYVMASLTLAAAGTTTELGGLFREVTGPGFYDTTRVAACAPQWGAAVCLGNRQHLEEVLQAATTQLSTLLTLIQTQNEAGLIDFFSKTHSQRKQVYP